MRQKHGLLLFLAACIPGCGQMHQGYMKRGASLLLAFSAIMAVAILLALGELCIFMPLIWLYAFFDCYNLRSRIADGTEPEDAFLFGLSDMDSDRVAALFAKRHSLIGGGLVALGVYLLYRVAIRWVMDLLSPFFDMWWMRLLLLYDIPRVLATLAIIALGLWFLRGPRAPKQDTDIPPFTPPTAPMSSAIPMTPVAPTEPEGEPEENQEDAPAEKQEADHGDQ